MIPAIKAEFRKIFSVRSTYIIIGLSFALIVFFAFYLFGWHIDASDLHNSTTLATDVTSAVNTIAIFSALIALLLITHEYRYNTIMYTLTASKKRSTVLIAKIFVVTIFALVFTTLVGFLSPLLSSLGASVHHLKFVPQTIHYGNLAWRSLFFGWGYTMAGILFGLLIRNQIGAIIALFIAPSTLEGLLSLLLKQNTDYLPFTALHTVLGQGATETILKPISPFHALLVFMAYLVFGWIIAWVLFLKRDAG